MAQKKLQPGSEYAKFDTDGDGIVTDEDGQSQKLKLNQPTVLRNKNGEYKLRLCEDLNAEMKKRAFHQFRVSERRSEPQAVELPGR